MAILNKQAAIPKAPAKVKIKGIKNDKAKKGLEVGKEYIVSEDLAKELCDKKKVAERIGKVEAVKAEGEK